MPTNKNAMTRYKILDEMLSDKYHWYTIDDLVEKVNATLIDMGINPVTCRCVEKDLEYIQGKPFWADIERYSISSKRCLRYADPSFSIFRKELRNEEKYLLSEVLSLVGQFDGIPNLEALDGLKRLGLSVRSPKQKIISFTKNVLENKTFIGELFTAISQKQVVEIHYHLFTNPKEEKANTVHPYLLKEYNCRWYLFAAKEPDMKIMNYSLDRIDRVVPLPSYKYKDFDGDDINKWFEDIIGVTLMLENPVRHIIFHVNDDSADYVETKPLHESQIHYKGSKESALRRCYPSLKGGAFFSIDCRENYELIRELSSFGDALLVLEPQDIQDKVCERAQKMLARYDNIRQRNADE